MDKTRGVFYENGIDSSSNHEELVSMWCHMLIKSRGCDPKTYLFLTDDQVFRPLWVPHAGYIRRISITFDAICSSLPKVGKGLHWVLLISKSLKHEKRKHCVPCGKTTEPRPPDLSRRPGVRKDCYRGAKNAKYKSN